MPGGICATQLLRTCLPGGICVVRLLHDISQHPIQDLDYLHDLHRDLSCGRCVKVAAHSGPAFPARSSPPEAGAPEKPNTFQATSALPSAGRRATFPPWRCFNYYTDHTPREAKGGGGPTRRAAINRYYRYYYFLKRSHMILRKFIPTLDFRLVSILPGFWWLSSM